MEDYKTEVFCYEDWFSISLPLLRMTRDQRVH